jgi:hypothetical protein
MSEVNVWSTEFAATSEGECTMGKYPTGWVSRWFAGLYPAFHDRAHSGHLEATEHDADPGVSEDGIERAGHFALPVLDQEPPDSQCPPTP